MPNNSLGSIDRTAGWLDRVRDNDPLLDYEIGGVALNDASQGLRMKTWTLRYEFGTARISSDDDPERVLFAREGITQIALAFDQLMAPFVAFVDSGGLAYWWFNPASSQMEFSSYLPAGSDFPRCTLDDTRELSGGWSDIILAYMRSGNLYHRRQRDNYAVEYLLKENAGGTLRAVGMNRGLCLQFRLNPGA